MNLEIWHEGSNATFQIHTSRNPILILTGFIPASLQVVHLNRNTVQSNNRKQDTYFQNLFLWKIMN